MASDMGANLQGMRIFLQRGSHEFKGIGVHMASALLPFGEGVL